VTDIAGKVVLVTGAASGIGKACALELGSQGAAAIALCDINEVGLRETLEELEVMSCETAAIHVDITSMVSVETAVGEAIDRFGHLDIVLNAAGIGMMGTMEALTEQDWKRVIDIDLWGTINVNRAVYPHMLRRGFGHIVNVASANGIYAPMPYLGPYTTSKFGVVGLSEALMVEGRPRGIKVTCACPGNVRTPIYDNSEFRGFNEGARALTKINTVIAERPEKTAQQIVRAIRRNRFIVVTTPVAKLSAFLRTHVPTLWFFYTRVFVSITERFLARYREN